MRLMTITAPHDTTDVHHGCGQCASNRRPGMASGERRVRIEPPADIQDRLLWQLATDVLAAHAPGAAGRCTNLQCTGCRAYPCPPAAHAMRAQSLAHQHVASADPPRPGPTAARAAAEPRPRPAAPPSAPVCPAAPVLPRRATGTARSWIGWFGDAPTISPDRPAPSTARPSRSWPVPPATIRPVLHHPATWPASHRQHGQSRGSSQPVAVARPLRPAPRRRLPASAAGRPQRSALRAPALPLAV